MKHIQLFEGYTAEDDEISKNYSDAYDVRISASGEAPNLKQEGKIVTSNFFATGRGRTKRDAAIFALAAFHLGVETILGNKHDFKGETGYHVIDLEDANAILDRSLEGYGRPKEEIINNLTKGIIDFDYMFDVLGYHSRVRAYRPEKIPRNRNDDNGGDYFVTDTKIEDDPWYKPSMADLRKAIARGDQEEIKRINLLRNRR